MRGSFRTLNLQVPSLEPRERQHDPLVEMIRVLSLGVGVACDPTGRPVRLGEMFHVRLIVQRK